MNAKITISDWVTVHGIKARVLGFDGHAQLVVGYYDRDENYHRAWVNRADVVAA